MKVLIARMNHETNTFSPVPTPLSSFGPQGPVYGPDALAANLGKRTAMAAFIDLAQRHGADMVPPIDASAYPSGAVVGEANRHICDTLVEAAPGCARSEERRAGTRCGRRGRSWWLPGQ